MSPEFAYGRKRILDYFERASAGTGDEHFLATGDLRIGPYLYEAAKFYSRPYQALSSQAVTSIVQEKSRTDRNLQHLLQKISAKEASPEEITAFTDHINHAKGEIRKSQPDQECYFEVTEMTSKLLMPRDAILDMQRMTDSLEISVSLILQSEKYYQPIQMQILCNLEALWNALQDGTRHESIVKETMAKQKQFLMLATSTRFVRPELSQDKSRKPTPQRAELTQDIKAHHANKVSKKRQKDVNTGASLPKPVVAGERNLEDRVSNRKKASRSRKGRVADPSKQCYSCGTSHTTLWRKAVVDGQTVTMCNSCGIKFATQAKKAAAAIKSERDRASPANAVSATTPIPTHFKQRI